MARYTGAVCRLCRREGTKLFLKGTKCFSEKCPIEKRNFAPGQHGKDRKAKIVGYGLQLREKQKAKRIYFTLEEPVPRVLREGHPHAGRHRRIAAAAVGASPGQRGLSASVLPSSRRQARQIVRHGHVEVNGRKVNIPSFQVKVGDEIAIREDSEEADAARECARSSPATSVRRSGSTIDADNLLRKGHCAAEARGRQPAGQRAADRRTLQQVKRGRRKPPALGYRAA